MRSILIFFVLTAGSAATPVLHAQGKSSSATHKIYHVLASKVSEPPPVPAELKKFSPTLKKLGNRFELSGKPKPVSLTPGKKVTVKLPQKLGQAEIELVDAATGSVQVKLQPPKRGEKSFVTRVSRFPTYITGDRRFKTSDGKQYVLILEKTAKKK